MKNCIHILFILCSISILSCKKKEDPETQTGTPIFTFSGTINNAAIDLAAGNNNYYMFTSYLLDGNGVYEFTGELKDKYCSSNCNNSLKITMKDYRPYATYPTNIDSSITPAYYVFTSPTGDTNKYGVTFNGSMGFNTAQSYAWDFGDGNTSTQAPPVSHIYLHPGIYTVTLNIQSTVSCSSSLTNTVHIGQAGNDLMTLFTPTPTGNSVSFGSLVNGGIPGYTYSWDFGDATTSSQATPTHLYSSAGIYLTTLSVTDATGFTTSHSLNVFTQPATSCYTTFFQSGATTNMFSPFNLAGIKIEWRDASGILWTSENANQPSTSMFKIISVSDYQNNSSGQPTKKIRAQINCKLFNGTNSINMTNADVVFAVAHP